MVDQPATDTGASLAAEVPDPNFAFEHEENTDQRMAKGSSWQTLSYVAIGLGVACLLLLGIWQAATRRADPVCRGPKTAFSTVVPSSDTVVGLQIADLQPYTIERNHILCMEVSDVLTADKLQALHARVDVANRAATDAEVLHRNALDTLSKLANPQTQAQADAANSAATNARTEKAAAQAALDDAQKDRTIVLYLNGKASPMTAQARAIPEKQKLEFSVAAPDDATDASAAFWRSLLSQPVHNGEIPLRIGVAEQGQPAPVSDWNQVQAGKGTAGITFLLYTPWVMWAAGVALIAIVVGLIGLSQHTTLLRSGSTVTNSYSLSLVQMALWLVLTTAGFIYIWIVTGECFGLITPGIFALIGISGATASVAQAIDYNNSTPIPASNGFFYDLVGNWVGGQVQLQRLQIIAWTLILAGIFCWSVIAKLILTSFDTNLLVLTGIANGVYVSLKPQENKGDPKA